MTEISTAVFTAQLQARNRSAGALPLITYYGAGEGERTELSGISFANWVDKTAGLLVDELLVEPGQPIRLDLLRTAPGHWMTLVWVAAAWRARCPVTLDGGSAEPAVEVVGPDRADEEPGAVERVACSLHPFGLGFGRPLPAGVLDYGVEVRAFPDSFAGPHPAPDEPAWLDGNRRLTQADVVDQRSGAARRELIAAPPGAEPWPVVRDALITPVITGGSAVVVVEADEQRRDRIAAAERVDPG